MVVMTSFYAEICCDLVSAYEASDGRICSNIRQFLIHSTLVYLLFNQPALHEFILG